MSNIEPREIKCYGIKFKRASSALTKYYDSMLKPVNLTVSQFSLLNDIKYIKTCNKTQLAKYAKLDRTTIIRNLNVLLEKGLVEEIEGETNRNNLIQLTKLGNLTIEQGYVLWKQAQKNIRKTIGEENLGLFLKTLEDIEKLT